MNFWDGMFVGGFFGFIAGGLTMLKLVSSGPYKTITGKWKELKEVDAPASTKDKSSA